MPFLPVEGEARRGIAFLVESSDAQRAKDGQESHHQS
jgi:hypothetical protein